MIYNMTYAQKEHIIKYFNNISLLDRAPGVYAEYLPDHNGKADSAGKAHNYTKKKSRNRVIVLFYPERYHNRRSGNLER